MIHWNPNPEIFDLGFIAPRWYGLCWGLAFYLSFLVMRRIFVAEKRPLQNLDTLTIYMIIFTILGARAGHMLFYEPAALLANPLEFFRIWNGGLASHGGTLGIMLGLWLFQRKVKGYSLVWLFDRLAIVAALSSTLIRIGNLMNSEIIGTPTTLPWAFVFERIDGIPRHPAQLYEAVVYLAIFGLLWFLYQRGVATRKPGTLFGVLMTTVFTARFVIEFVKEHQVDFESTLPLDMGQLLSLPFIVVGAYFLLRRSPQEAASASNR
mgnify:FL=1